MTAKQFDINDRGDRVKKDGWFSWRHQSRDAHDAARARYGGHRAERQNRKRQDAEARNAVTPIERTRAYRREQGRAA